MAEARAITIENLSVRLGERDVVRGVSLGVEAGQITAVLGPNGAGKTTLLRAVVGLVPYRGRIVLEGTELAALSRTERARRVAYVPQRSALDAPLSVATVVSHGRYAHTRSAGLGRADKQAIDAAMEATDIADLAERPFTELSGGEQRRVLIARALATGARIIVLDEPAASLDVGHALALFALLGRLAGDGQAVVVVLHDLNDALRVADRGVLLAAGSVAAAGPIADVIAEGPIRRVYGVELETEPRLSFRLAGEPL